MTTMVYTRVEYEWDGVAEQYVVKSKDGYEYDGPIVLMKSAKKWIGAIIGVAAVVFAPALAATFNAALGSSVFSAAGAGALGGAVGGGIAGGWQGAALGGVGGYFAAGGGGDLFGGAASGAGAGEGSVASLAADGGAGLAPSGFGTGGPAAISSAVGGAGDAAIGELGGVESLAADGGAGLTPSGFGTTQPAGATLDTPSYMENTAGISPEEAGRGEAAGSPQVASGGGGAADKASDAFNWNKAGMEAGKQLLGVGLSEMTKPSYLDAYEESIKANTATNQKITDFNLAGGAKKSAVGDTLVGDGNAINPEDYARNRANEATTRGNLMRDAQSERMRYAGLDPRAIASMERQYEGQTATNAGTAYDSGQQTGVGLRTSTLTAGGAMYSPLGYTQDTTGSGVNYLNQADQNRNQSAGRAIDAVVGAGTPKDEGTGTQNTRKQTLPSGQYAPYVS